MCNKKPIEACKEKLLEAIEEAEVKAEEVEEEYAAKDFELQSVYGFMGCISVISILVNILLYWLKQLDNHLHLASVVEDLQAIRQHAKSMKKRMRAASREVYGEHSASQARRRYAQLRNKLIGTVNSLRFFR